MRKIRVRIAQRNLCKLLSQKENFEIINHFDEVVCLVSFVNPSPTISGKPKNSIVDGNGKEYNSIDVRQSEESQNLCLRCKKKEAKFVGEIWEDGEEHRVPLCGYCSQVYPKRSIKPL